MNNKKARYGFIISKGDLQCSKVNSSVLAESVMGKSWRNIYELALGSEIECMFSLSVQHCDNL